jgi:hypothetical protein
MLTQRMALGRADVAALLMAHSPTYQDDGLNYDLLARSNRVALAGIGGEVAFYMLYLALAFEQPTPIAVTALIDDVRQPTKLYNLVGVGARKNVILEVSLLVPFTGDVPGGATRGLFAPRGSWIQVEIASAFPGAAAFVQIDGVECEHEVVREGKAEGANPP